MKIKKESQSNNRSLRYRKIVNKANILLLIYLLLLISSLSSSSMQQSTGQTAAHCGSS